MVSYMDSTRQWIPFDAVVPIILKNDEYPEFPHLSGTGFIVIFPPYDYVFLVTARHCVVKDEDNSWKGMPFIPVEDQWIPLTSCITAKEEKEQEFFEDVAIFPVVDIPEKKELARLYKRAIKLIHQDNVNTILNFINRRGENLRIAGFPHCSKGINYDGGVFEYTPRGTYGKITQLPAEGHIYELGELNWNEGELFGFSGSPVLSLHPSYSGVTSCVVGVVLHGSSKKIRAININVVTDIISCWIVQNNSTEVLPDR